MKLYRLENNNQIEQAIKDNSLGDVKLIGFFQTKEECQIIIEKLKSKPGFNLPTASFNICKVRINSRHKKLSILYRLTHEYYDGKYDYISELGLFATKSKAIKKMKKLRNSRKYKRYPDGFSIDEIEIGQIGWSEGFVGWYD